MIAWLVHLVVSVLTVRVADPGGGEYVKPRLSQRATFRIILRDGRQHALAWQLTMRGEDIYAGPPRSIRPRR